MNSVPYDDLGNRRYRLLVEHSTDWFWETDANGVYTYSSPQVEKLLGYSPEEIVGMSAFDLMAPEEAKRVYGLFKRALEARCTIEILENTVLHKNGKPVVLETSGVPIINENNELIGYRGIDRDITQRIEAEKALRFSEARYRAVVEDSPALICRFQPDCSISYVNASYCNYFGKSAGELIGTSFLELIPVQDRSDVMNEIGSLSIESPTRSHEHRVIDSTGNVRWQRWTNHALFDDSGDLRIYQAIGEDITEYKKAEDALQRAELKFRTIFNSSSEALMMLDERGFLDCNQTTLTLFGVKTVEDFCGYSPSDVSPPYQADGRDSLSAANERMKSVLSQGHQRFNWLHKRMDTNEPFPAEVIIKAMELDGKQVLLASVRDITHQKIAEKRRREIDAQLQQVQRLEGLGVLAGGIAHDFNNILMGIMGNAELVLDELSPESPFREELGDIISGTTRAAELCQQMLAYAGKGQFDSLDINLRDLVMESLTMLQTVISKKCSLDLKLHPELLHIHGDPIQIRQVLMNLVVNASEAMGNETGVITLQSGSVEIVEGSSPEEFVLVPEAPGTYIYLEITDTGCGIDATVLPRIFDPFYTTKFTGRGLGLSAVLGIVRSHSGALTVGSQLGKGTTFRVLFPAVPSGKPIQDRLQKQYLSDRLGTALLVDDELSIRKVCFKLLERIGYNVILAENGQQAVAKYRANQSEIDVVLLDLTMPVMNGIEAFRELRKIDPGIQVILASGYSEVDLMSRYQHEGFLGHLQKPYTLSKLRAELGKLT